MSEELKPCPFCGQSEFLIERLDYSSSVVICQGMLDEHSACLAQGPVGVQDDDGEDQPGKAAAIREWNSRAIRPAQTEQQPVAVSDGFVLMPARLTAENGAKGALSGEFTIRHETTCSACYFDEADDDCEVCGGEIQYVERITVPWETIKEIYSGAVTAVAAPITQPAPVEQGERVVPQLIQASSDRATDRFTAMIPGWAADHLRAITKMVVPAGYALVPMEPTPAMIDAAEEAHMPFGDMDIALRMAILAAPALPAEVSND